jgi:DNA uptake protein ComE-like DNA-binding protein
VDRICGTIIVGFIFSLALVSVTPSATATISQLQDEERINIDTPSIGELERLLGIGLALASRIGEHCRRRGLFKHQQDIAIVRGMSAKLYRRIAQLIRI